MRVTVRMVLKNAKSGERPTMAHMVEYNSTSLKRPHLRRIHVLLILTAASWAVCISITAAIRQIAFG